MARKAANAAPSAKPASKRTAADKPTPTRQSKRVKATPVKSAYFEPESDDDVLSSADAQDDKESAFSDEEVKDESSESDAVEEASSEEEPKPKKGTSRGRASKGAAVKNQADEKELWKPGAKLELGTQLIIKKPKAREAGDTPYSDDAIHPNTMLFLKDLAANNDRQWLKMHDPDYRVAFDDWKSFVEVLSEKVSEVDETIPELPVKDLIFRIYRDIRFSKDPTPYKTYFSAAWSRTGRKGPYAAYYVQIKPNGGSFVGAGLWCPEAHPLSLLRRDIDREPHKIKRVLTEPGIRKAFLGGIAADDKKVVKAFVNLAENKSNALKKNPKGYDKEHADIELLRLKNFTLGAQLRDDEVVGAKGLERIAGLIGCMVPFVTYLNSIVMPDEESGDSDGSEDDENDGEDSNDGTAEGEA